MMPAMEMKHLQYYTESVLSMYIEQCELMVYFPQYKSGYHRRGVTLVNRNSKSDTNMIIVVESIHLFQINIPKNEY